MIFIGLILTHRCASKKDRHTNISIMYYYLRCRDILIVFKTVVVMEPSISALKDISTVEGENIAFMRFTQTGVYSHGIPFTG